MGKKLALSEEQIILLEAGTKPALEQLCETGEYLPTLYLHDGDKLVFYNIVVSDLDELHETVQSLISSQKTTVVSYALFYNGSLEDQEGSEVDALLIETGDMEDETAHELAHTFSRQDSSTGPLIYLGNAPHLLRPEQNS